MATVPITISSDLMITASVSVMKYILPKSQMSGAVTLARGGERPLSNPVISFTPGGCVYQGPGCWHGIGHLDISGIDEQDVIKRVSFKAVYNNVEVVAMEVESDVSVDPGMYFVSLFFTVELPNKGFVRLVAL